MKVETYKCDECGAVKQEANHWYAAISGPGSFECCPLFLSAPSGHPLHICGMQCLIKAMTKAMSKAMAAATDTTPPKALAEGSTNVQGSHPK